MADAETTRAAIDAAKAADESRMSSTSAATSIKGEYADMKKKEAHKEDSSSHRHTKESTRGRGDERRRRHSSSSSPASSRSRSRSRSATRSRKESGSRRGGESSRSSRHHSSRHHRHHDSSSRRSRSRERHGRDRHSRRRHSRSRSRSNSRDRHREKSRRPSRRDSRDENGSSRRKSSDDRKRDGDRHRDHKPTSSHRKRSRDEKEDARGIDEKRLKEVKPDREKENGAMVKTIEKKNGQEEPAVAVKESSRDLQNENAPPQEEETSSSDVKQQENGHENSGSTSPVAENSSQSSAESKSNGVLVDPLGVASSARKLIEEAKATLLKGEHKAVPSTPAVDVNSIKMDILKALAEARSTIAEIKGSDTVASEKEKTEKSVESESSTEKVVHSQQEPSRRSQSQSPKKKSQSESASKVAAAAAAVDEFDMFSMAELDDSAMPMSPGVSALTVSEVNLQSNCDDAEGYYTTTVGEVLNGTYRVLGVVGKGVFSTVLRCARIAPSKGNELDAVAIKLIRNNEVMRDAAQTEVKLLKELSERDPRDKKHCVRLLDTFEHRNHVALVFEPMQMNVREAMKKFGGKGGISIQAVRIFSKHLLIALNHLEACAIVHADIKPDNILLDDKQTTIKLCDFGSAFKVDEGKQDPTPYLVSRFYRAPEIVLGLAYDRSVDMWSIGCCLFEMFTGKVMFPGSTNNEMLKLFMELKGKIPNKLIKKHRQAYIEQFQMEPHFTEDLKFCSRESDRVTGKPILRLMDNVKAKNDLGSSLLAAKSSTDDRKLVLELRGLLERMLTLDPTKRISVREALAHPFVKTS